MLTIGICGASGSGKSTLAAELAARIHGSAILLNQDAYYRDHPDLSFSEREKLNFDEPGIFEHDLLYQDIRSLMDGTPILRKAYDFSLHKRADTDEIILPGDVLIFEGIHAFHDSRLRNLLDFRIFVQVDPDICLLRRVQRDILERNRSVEGVAAQYMKTVKPMYDRWIRNYIDYADLVVMGGGKNQRIVDILAFYINHGMSAGEDEKAAE